MADDEKEPRVISGIWICFWALLVLILIIVFLVLTIVVLIFVMEIDDDFKEHKESINKMIDSREGKFAQAVEDREQTLSMQQRLSVLFQKPGVVQGGAISCASPFAVDMNGDQLDDIVCRQISASGPQNAFAVYLYNQEGNYEGAVNYGFRLSSEAGGVSSSLNSNLCRDQFHMTIKDANGDGYKDIVCGSVSSRSYTSYVVSYYSGLTLRADPTTYTLPDIDGDQICADAMAASNSYDVSAVYAAKEGFTCFVHNYTNSEIMFSWVVASENTIYNATDIHCEGEEITINVNSWPVKGYEESNGILCLNQKSGNSSLVIGVIDSEMNVTFHESDIENLPDCNDDYYVLGINSDSFEDIVCMKESTIVWTAIFKEYSIEDGPEFEVVIADTPEVPKSCSGITPGDFNGDLETDLYCTHGSLTKIYYG